MQLELALALPRDHCSVPVARHIVRAGMRMTIDSVRGGEQPMNLVAARSAIGAVQGGSMDFSAQLDALQQRAAEAKQAAEQAASESREQLRQRIDQAQVDMNQAAKDAQQQAGQAAADAHGASGRR